MELETYTKASYISLCDADEIERIFNVSCATDYLLKVRANATVEHIRIFRVFLARMRNHQGEWSFSQYFDTSPFNNYIRQLHDDDYETVKNLPAGFIFCNNVNGRIVKTRFGNIITISESLRYFLYYMNLAFLDFGENEVPIDVKAAAIKIAIRTMLQSEALDFDIDPRGDIPKPIDTACKYHTGKQLEFVIGHEYSHHFLGHLDKNNLIEAAMMDALDSQEFKHKIYSYSQKDEFAADIDAIERPNYSPEQKEDMLNRALFFFVYLDLYQDIKEQISPSSGGVKSHPDPIDRFYNLRDNFKETVNLNDDNLMTLLACRDEYRKSLKEDVALNIESYEFYGSIYLDQWRGKVLIDRVDF